MIRHALQRAQLHPEDIGLIEAHGTGTAIGDGIELRALQRVFGHVPPRSCALGSVKTNIGHTDCSSGVVGLIKTIYALRLGIIPPSLHCETPCSALQDQASPFLSTCSSLTLA